MSYSISYCRRCKLSITDSLKESIHVKSNLGTQCDNLAHVHECAMKVVAGLDIIALRHAQLKFTNESRRKILREIK